MPKAKKSPFEFKSDESDSNTTALVESGYLPKLEKFCAYQDRCRSEVIQKMRRIQVPETYWSSLLKRLEDQKFIDEHRFAMMFARSKFSQKGWGPERVRIELQRRNINMELIEEALRQINVNESMDKLKAILVKYRRTVKSRDSYELRMKMLRHALAKGYTFADANKVLKDMEEHSE